MNKGSKLKNAILYATSLYEGAVLCKKLAETHKDVDTLLQLLAAGFKDFSLLNNPTWPLEAKKQLVDALADKIKLGTPIINTLKILIENRKIDILPLILRQFKEVYNTKQNIAEIDVETVTDLSELQDEKLKQKLSNLFKKNIVVNYHKNPDILGGLVIKCGTVLIDCSIKHQLDSLEQLMKGTK